VVGPNFWYGLTVTAALATEPHPTISRGPTSRYGARPTAREPLARLRASVDEQARPRQAEQDGSEVKPFALEGLKLAIRHMCRRRHLISQRITLI
jgi:hypothetical protein